jgi:hypothetical protein
MDPRIARIRTKIAAQNVRLAPVDLEAVTAFERVHGVELPSAHREFLVHVANGGAGPPEYGLLPLGGVATSASACQSIESPPANKAERGLQVIAQACLVMSRSLSSAPRP